MQKIRDLIYYILLATTPSLFAHPGHSPSCAASEAHWTEDAWDETPDYQIQEKWNVPTTYDEVIDMLEDLEFGTPEEKYSLAEFEKITNYVILLARAGILPNDFEKAQKLEEDIYDLMYGKGSPLQLIHALENSYDHTIIPAVLQGIYANDTILQCGFLKKVWKKTKKVAKKVWKKTARFCKKHKKEIIIGTAAVLGGGALFLACKKQPSSHPAASAALEDPAATFHSNDDPFNTARHEVSKPELREEKSAACDPCKESPYPLDYLAPHIQENIERDPTSLQNTLQQERASFESEPVESRDALSYSFAFP